MREQLQGKRRVRDGPGNRDSPNSGTNPPLKRPRDEDRGEPNRHFKGPPRGVDSRRASPPSGQLPHPHQPPHSNQMPPPGFPFMHPQMLLAMGGQQGGPPADPALLASMIASMSSARGGGVIGRRGRGGRREQNGRPNQLAKSTLFVRDVPESKLNFADLNNYFSKFGSLSNIRLMPPGKALLEFSTRQQAIAALNSVDAVFGNRHVKLSWARENENSADDSSRGGRGRRTSNGAQRGDNESKENEEKVEDPEQELQRKRKEIKEARAAEMKQKAEQQAAYQGAINEQKELFRKLEGGFMNVEQKKEVLKRLKELNDVISKIDHANTKKRQSQPSQTPATTNPWKRQRPMPKRGPGLYTLDNRPKAVRILGANQGISPDAAAAIFRDTQRAELQGSTWVLHFSTRAAAESALRAVRVLKRGFGLGASAQIINPNVVQNNSNVPPPQKQPMKQEPSVKQEQLPAQSFVSMQSME